MNFHPARLATEKTVCLPVLPRVTLGGHYGNAMSEYAEKLKHPSWQRKRLEVLQRDGFKCRYCKDETSTLHVHHLHYVKGRNPWDYDNASLVTLCHVCHDNEHDSFAEAKNCLIDSLRTRGAMFMDIIGIAVAFDLSGSNDVQMSGDEWFLLAGIIGDAMKFRNAGGDLISLRLTHVNDDEEGKGN